MTLPPQRIEYLRRESTSALVCLPFLDTDLPEERALANQILAERGYADATVRRLRALARVGLWYQVVAWDDAHLDLWDVLLGYALLAAPLSVFVLMLSWFWGLATLGLAGLLLLAAGLGSWLTRDRGAG